jgi:hypothetical protein
MTDFQYVGNELDLFANATNWKRYWASRVRGFLKGDVLEVGAGLGTNTELLLSDRTASWTCLEPDPALAERMRARFRDTALWRPRRAGHHRYGLSCINEPVSGRILGNCGMQNYCVTRQ